MLHSEALSLLLGAVLLGIVHGAEPGHGWPVAATYALDQTNKWFYGFASSLILGVGHLISSLAMVAAFFYAKSYFSLTRLNEPLTLVGGIQIGGPVSLVAGVLLIVLGVREYVSHSRGGAAHPHDHDHDAHEHEHDDHATAASGLIARFRKRLPGSGHAHDHSHDALDEAADRGLLGIAWFAFLLGFAHEEEFEIIALCAGSPYCLELMSAYAITVLVVIVGLTMLLVAGYTQYEKKIDRYTPYLPIFSAAVLILMGLGFIIGLY